MIRKKNGFFTFIFSLLPGAGEMYMGFMKQGVSLMGSFFLLLFLASWLNIGPLLLALPVFWFYGFFHVHNLRGMPDEEFYALEDHFFFNLDEILPKGQNWMGKYRKGAAVVLIIVGAAALLENLEQIIVPFLPRELVEIYWVFSNRVPECVLSVALIVGGIYLIRGKKQQLEEEEGGSHEN